MIKQYTKIRTEALLVTILFEIAINHKQITIGVDTRIEDIIMWMQVVVGDWFLGMHHSVYKFDWLHWLVLLPNEIIGQVLNKYFGDKENNFIYLCD